MSPQPGQQVWLLALPKPRGGWSPAPKRSHVRSWPRRWRQGQPGFLGVTEGGRLGLTLGRQEGLLQSCRRGGREASPLILRKRPWSSRRAEPLLGPTLLSQSSGGSWHSASTRCRLAKPLSEFMSPRARKHVTQGRLCNTSPCAEVAALFFRASLGFPLKEKPPESCF